MNDMEPVQTGRRGVTPLTGRHVRLVRVQPTHLAFVHRLLTDPVVGYRHLLSGHGPTPYEFLDAVEQEVFEQFVVQFRSSLRPAGLVRALDANVTDGRATVSIAVEPRLIGSGIALEGSGLLADYLFTHLGFRKLYAYIPEFNLENLQGPAEFMRTEAILRKHRYYAGQYWDVWVVAMEAPSWQELREQFLEDLVLDESPPIREGPSRRRWRQSAEKRGDG